MTTVIIRADVTAYGPVDGTGTRHDVGSYVLLSVVPDGREVSKVRISMGAAEVLAAELLGIVKDHSEQSG